MASLTQCTWVWVSSRSWWWTGRPVVLPSMGLQRVRHDWWLNWLIWNIQIRIEDLLLFSHEVMSNSVTSEASQASLSFIISWSLLKLRSIVLVMLSNHLILSHPLLFLPSVFPSISLFQWVGFSASASILPMNIQGSFPLGLTGLIILLSKGFSHVFSTTTIQKHQLFHSLLYGPTLTSVCEYWKNHSFE